MKNKIITYSFVIFISIFMILSVITKKDEISISERRHLANMPKFTLEGILDKNNSYDGVNNVKTIYDNAGKKAIKVDKPLIDLLELSIERYEKKAGTITSLARVLCICQFKVGENLK